MKVVRPSYTSQKTQGSGTRSPLALCAMVDLLAEPVVVRDPAGAVWHANPAAAVRLGIEADPTDASLTVIGRDPSGNPDLFVLSGAGEGRHSIAATSSRIEFAGRRFELLRVRPRLTADGETRSARDVVADVVRRLRRHLRREHGDARLVVDARGLLRDLSVRADGIRVTQLVLSGLDVLGHRAGSTVYLSASPSGCRLRIATQVDAPPSERPDLRRHRRLVEEIKPLLRAVRGTLELRNHPREPSRYVLTLPATTRAV